MKITKTTALSLLVNLGLALGVYTEPVPAKPEYEAGVVLVKLKAHAAAASRAAACALVAADVIKRYDLFGVEQWRLGTPEDARDASVKLAALPGVEHAQPNYIYHTARTPGDTRYSELWGMNNTGQAGGTINADIDAPEAWDLSTGATGVIVAVIDTGVDYTHPDLAANMWRNPGEIPANGIDDDHNGYVDDVYGIDPRNHDTDPLDDNGHGTHCAGTIGAVGNNSLGVVGVCWEVRIMACKFLNDHGSGSTADAIECIQYATRMGARVMNNSWGGGSYDQVLFDAIAVANQTGILFCAAAGNSGADNDISPAYPASYSNANILAVAATDNHDALASFSCYGAKSVDIAAPGVGILSTIPSNAYGLKNGTSMAAPHCSGAAALVLASRPGLSVSALKAALMDNAEPKTSLNHKCVTGARLNVFQAVKRGALSLTDKLTITKAGYKLPWNKNFADSASLVGYIYTTNVVPDLAKETLTIRFGDNEFFTAALPAKLKLMNKGSKASYLALSTNALQMTKGTISVKRTTRARSLIKFAVSTKKGTLRQLGFAFNPETTEGRKTYTFDLILGDSLLHGSAMKTVWYKNVQYKGCSGKLRN